MDVWVTRDHNGVVAVWARHKDVTKPRKREYYPESESGLYQYVQYEDCTTWDVPPLFVLENDENGAIMRQLFGWKIYRGPVYSAVMHVERVDNQDA